MQQEPGQPESLLVEAVPTEQSLYQLLAMAHKYLGRTVAQKWHAPEKKNDYELELTIPIEIKDVRSVKTEMKDPKWVLHKTIAGRRAEIFSITSGNLFLVLNFIFAECPEIATPLNAPAQENWNQNSFQEDEGTRTPPDSYLDEDVPFGVGRRTDGTAGDEESKSPDFQSEFEFQSTFEFQTPDFHEPPEFELTPNLAKSVTSTAQDLPGQEAKPTDFSKTNEFKPFPDFKPPAKPEDSEKANEFKKSPDFTLPGFKAPTDAKPGSSTKADLPSVSPKGALEPSPNTLQALSVELMTAAQPPATPSIVGGAPQASPFQRPPQPPTPSGTDWSPVRSPSSPIPPGSAMAPSPATDPPYQSPPQAPTQSSAAWAPLPPLPSAESSPALKPSPFQSPIQSSAQLGESSVKPASDSERSQASGVPASHAPTLTQAVTSAASTSSVDTQPSDWSSASPASDWSPPTPGGSSPDWSPSPPGGLPPNTGGSSPDWSPPTPGGLPANTGGSPPPSLSPHPQAASPSLGTEPQSTPQQTPAHDPMLMDPTSLGTGVFKQWSPFAHASPTAHAAPAQQAPKSEAVAGAAPEAVSEAAEEHTRDSKTEEPSPKSLEVTSRRDPAARDLAKTIAPGVQTIDAIKSPAPVEAESIETADVKETSHRPAADSKIRKTRIFGADEVADLTGVRSSDRPETLQEPSAEILTQEVIDNAGKTLVRTDTALMNSQLLAYFIQQEFERHQHQPNQFALAIFDFRNKNQPLTHAALLEITKCLEGLKKPFDLLGHYRVREIAAFFPLSTDTQCQAFVEKAIRAFQELGISGIEKGNLKVRVGIASAADANDVLKLFASAARAKDLCSLNKVTSLCARDSRWEEQRALVKQAILKSDHSATEAALKACLEITEAFEPQDKRRVEALEQLGNFYFEQKKFPEAEPLLLKATRTREQMHGSTSLEFAASAYQLANCYYRLGKFQIAENLLRTAVNIQTNVYGPDHVIVGTTLRYLGAAYNRQHKYPETMACYDRALKILEQALGPGHSDTINMRVLRDTAYNNSQQASQNSVAVEQKQS